MNRKILLAVLGLSLLACKFLFPNTPTPETDTSRAQSPASDSFSVVRLHPGDGELMSLLAAEAQKAAALQQMPVVEFDATWCPPCKAIDQGLKEKNRLMLDAYAGTYIIKLDVDEWGWGDSSLAEAEQVSSDGRPVAGLKERAGATAFAAISPLL